VTSASLGMGTRTISEKAYSGKNGDQL